MTSPAMLDSLFPHARAAWVLYEDDDLLAIDKPHHLSTHAPEPGRVDDAHSRLLAWLRERGGISPYLGIHQRLDKGTSGVLIFTRRKNANPSLAKQFEGREVQKTYVAAVSGKHLPAKGTMRDKLATGDGGAMRVVTRGGQEAITRFSVLRRAGDRALVELSPETGRTHQIRVQLASRGAPVAGDRLYDGEACARMLLHATRLGIVHPSTGKRLSIVAEPPQAFAAWLDGAPGPFVDVEAIESRLRAAAEARYGVARDPSTTAFRIANAGGDDLPGVSVDLYGEHLVVAIGEELDEAARERVLDAADRLGARGIHLKVRPKHASVIGDARRAELAPRDAVRGESAPEEFTILENGLPFLVRIGEGLSTGIFLDQRENRRRVRELAKGARLLNLFSYTGAFTVAAVAGGASSSVSVDASRGALAWAQKNLDAVGADPSQHKVVEADALAWLVRAKIAQPRFDLVICDPPSFATTKTSTFAASSDYTGLAERAIGLVAEGGKLLACTNHRGIARGKLRRQLHEAARAAGREVVQMKDLPDPPDHPAEPGAEPHLKSILVTFR